VVRVNPILLVGDIHLADKAPSSCTDSYCDDLFDLLEQTVVMANDLDAVPVWAGDVFHVKAPARTSHRIVQRALRLIEGYKHQLRIVPGNHDMSGDRLESLYETQPLGVLLEAGAKLLIGWDEDLPIFGVPWLQGYGEGVVPDDLLRELDDFRAVHDKKDRLVVAHAPLYPPGIELTYENIPMEKWADAMGNEGNCYYGHVHDFHGVTRVGGVTFCNNGAITRGALTESHLNRKVTVTTWGENGFGAVMLDAKPASEVFRLAEKTEEKESAARLDEFLAGIDSTTLTVTSIESVMDDVKARGLGKDVEKIIGDLLEAAS
jgi:DNA repair exonuclease SbcCD nuclease subunit